VIALAIWMGAGWAWADPQPLRLASVVPDGSGFARELKAMAIEVESASSGRVHIKLYLGAVAGDELEMLERVRRGQLDGVASAGMACEQISPSLKVMRMPGLFESRDDHRAVLGRLKAVWDREFLDHGFHNLGETLVGPAIVFSRYPERSIADLRKHVYWIWDADKTMAEIFPVLGLKTLALPIYEAARAYEQGRVDGFTMTPMGALAFQWSSTARYYIDLPLAYVTGCLAIASRAFDALGIGDQQALSAAAAKAAARIGDVTEQMDHELVTGLFRRQGLQQVKVDALFWQQYRDSTREARAVLARREVPPALLERVEGLLVEVRGHHGR